MDFVRMNTRPKGQAVIIIVVGMVIALTIGLAVAAQSVINLQSATDEEQSQRAFSAAEAGVERALSDNQNITNESFGDDGTITTNVVPITVANNLLLNDGLPILQNDPIDVWVANYPDFASPRSGTLTIYWGNSGNCTDAALEVIALSGAVNAPTMTKYTSDPCTVRGNGFTPSDTGSFSIGGTTLRNRLVLTLTNGRIVRVIPLYASTTIGVAPSGGLTLPPQGSRIESVGQVGDTQRKITVYRGFPKVPYEFFPNVIFSP